MANKTDKEGIVPMFDTLPASLAPLNRPTAGTTYKYTWIDDTKKDDWRTDGYRWRQNGSLKNVQCSTGTGTFSKTYFQVNKLFYNCM